jgi:hypothetical protein
MSEALTSNGGINQELNQIEKQPQLQQFQPPHQPGTFRRILGGIAGMAGNMFAPGLGGALGNLIGGGSSFAAGLGASGSAANAANLAAANQLLAVAQQSNQDEEMTELASNLEKSKHETFMAVIQNIT